MTNETYQDKVEEAKVNETYEEKVAEAKAYLVNYLKDGKEIKRNQKDLSMPNLKPEQREQINNNIIHLQECQRSTVFIVQYEHKVNIKQELDSGRTPLQVMEAMSKSIEKKYPKTDPTIVSDPDTTDDRQRIKQVDAPAGQYQVDHVKVKENEKEQLEQKKAEPESKPLVSETLTVTHHVAQPNRAIGRYLEAKEKQEKQKQQGREPSQPRHSRGHSY